MEARSLKQIAELCGGEFVRGVAEATVTRVCTDTRSLQPGDLFFALRGEHFDGHAFLAEAAARGAAGLVAERAGIPAEMPPCGVIVVPNSRQALGRLAARNRAAFGLPVIAVAGSNGKTSTKELVASVLRQKLKTVWSEASFNNDIGVPLTLLKIERQHEVAVLEAGTNHPGELRALIQLMQPSLGVITCIGREHLEFFDDLAGVAEEEGALAELLPPSGTLLLNGDDEWSETLVRRSRCQVVRVGFGERNHWKAHGLRMDKTGVTFRVASPLAAFDGEYRINLLGRHQVGNALFAIALGSLMGLQREEIARGLADCQPAKMRLQMWELGGVRVLDDAYNANADSMMMALRTLQEFPCKGRKVAVLGDMAELGRHSEAAHEEVGRQAAALGIDQIFALGKMAPVVARGARLGGLNRVLEFADVEAAAQALKSFLKTGDCLLLKASRATRLERITEHLRGFDAGRRN
jgi:UDP-N-acetylmuramoyl-tripeptide--D-alanyl-D-alanine ligase